MKNWSAQVIQAVKDDFPRAEFIELQLVGGTIYLTTAGHDIEYSGRNYIASGLVLDFDTARQQTELRVQQFSIKFTAADQTMVALFQNDNQQNRKIKFTQAVLTYDHKIIGPLLESNYIIDSYSVDDDEQEATITVEMSNYLSNFQSVGGIRTTQSSFHRFYPGSTSFINSKDIDKQLIWGGK